MRTDQELADRARELWGRPKTDAEHEELRRVLDAMTMRALHRHRDAIGVCRHCGGLGCGACEA